MEKVHTGHRVDPDLKRSATEGASECDVYSSPKRLRKITEEDGELEPTVPKICTSTPVSKSRVLPKTWPVSPVQIENNVQSAEAIDNPTQTVPKKIDVSIKVKWPSKDTERKLPEGLESLGKMLARGTYKQIAHAAW